MNYRISSISLSNFSIKRRLFSLISLLNFYFLLGVCGISYARSVEASFCVSAIGEVERELHIPDGFLQAMGRVESGRLESDGLVSPWPWTVTAEGQGHYYASEQEAIAAVRDFQARGIRSIDVGCMQINLLQHPNAFPSLEDAFAPVNNARYGGNFLIQMYNHTGSWPRAAAAYHSQTPDIGTPYQWKVLEAWATPQSGTENIRKSQYMPFHSKNSPSLYNMASNTSSVAHYGSSNIVRDFHPFVGNNHYAPLPPAHHMTARGRDLASYRAMPVMLAAPLH